MYLKEIKVPIPFDQAKIVIRKEKAVQMELNRSYSPETKDSRVTRKTIGQAVPLYPGMMYPNENYFALIPNTVPEEIRDAFLLRCARKREQAELKKNPEAMMRKVKEGIRFLKENQEPCTGENGGETAEKVWYIRDEHDLEYARSVFSDLYEQMETLAVKYPDAVVSAKKVKMFNRILKELKLTLPGHRILQCLELIEEPREEQDGQGNRYVSGMSNSDVLMHLAWYKNALA